jgi:hypothetical protein
MRCLAGTESHSLGGRLRTFFARSIELVQVATRTKSVAILYSLGKCYSHWKVPDYVYHSRPIQNLRIFWWTTTLYEDGRLITLFWG